MLIELERLARLLLLLAALADSEALTDSMLLDVEALFEAADVLAEALSL
ncbi:hypothetical protein M3M35_06975 [Fructilactobacillus myrtifloralis]|uniref:Uncharacterized protein n=1 Tax=Fructilactobacillus myrtifloralis TaxID=2940301 RepID=A0ABY5BN75_9LACO|nr:hypothetical protein [Fructilactobacillus myrtifloralis]USS85025.1 hypothetical protein M3M35_06975 [Fructilactobacillus myrtifloralis]